MNSTAPATRSRSTSLVARLKRRLARPGFVVWINGSIWSDERLARRLREKASDVLDVLLPQRVQARQVVCEAEQILRRAN